MTFDQAAYRREYYKKNKDKMNAQHKIWREENRENNRAIKKAWRERNPDKYLAICRNANTIRKRLIGGQGISKFYSSEIIAIYDACPEGYEVDHIIPLRGKTACGLHVPWNLQYLTHDENVKKSNRLDSDY